MWDIEYYVTAKGACPTREFLSSLHKKDELPAVLRAMELLKEFGYQLRRPHADILEDGIYELRIPLRHKQFRLLYFYFFQEGIVISHGLRKESKVNPAEIEKAKDHRADYLARHARKR